MSSPFLEPGQLGSRRFAVRPIPGPRFLGGVLLSATVAVVICLFVPGGGRYVAAGGAVGLLIVHGGVIGSGLIEQHRVHDRGLLLGPTVAGTTPFVIPWSTVDPSSLQVHRRANFIGGRYGPNGPSSNLRMAPYSTSAVSVTGLLPQLASPRRRKSCWAARHHVHGPLGEVPLPEAPTVRWLTGVRDPEPLARAVEAALVAAGHPAAQGAADRALAHPVREKRQSPRS